MATSSQRRLNPNSVRQFGSGQEAFKIRDLTELQTKSYVGFLQEELTADKRKNQGLESVFREIFPIQSYDTTVSLEYLRYELGKPRYTPEECRQLRLTYGKPLKVYLRLNREQPFEEEVYLGDIPVMLGGGEFIINGAERVVVNQLHRSPGVDFVEETEGTGDRRVPSARIIPDRGSWIEINVTKKDSLSVRIDQSGKFSVMTLLRAMSDKLSTDSDLLKAFYEEKSEKIADGRSAAK
jgi:DNA-directed RNA polymerase subunit beta